MQSLRQKQIDEVLEYHDRINRDVFEREKKHVWNSGLQTSIPNRQDLTIEAEVKSKVQNILYDIQNITQSIHYLPSEEIVTLAARTYSIRPKRAGPRGPRGPSEEKEPEGELKESKSESDTSSLDSGSDLDSDSDRPDPGYAPLSRPVREEHPEGYEEDPEEFRRYSKQINEKNLARIKSGKESFDNIFRFLTKVIRDWNNLVDYFNLKMRQQNYTGTEQNNFLSSVKTLVEPLKNALSKIVLLKTQTHDYFKLYNTLDNMLQLVEAAPPLNYIPHDILSTTVPDPGLTFGATDSTVRLARSKLTEYATRVADISLLVPTTTGEKESIDRLIAWYKGEGAKLQKLINRTRTPNPASHRSAVASIVRFFGTAEDSFRQAQNNILKRLGRREREGKVVKELFSKHPSSEVGEEESLSDPTLPSYRRGRVGSESSFSGEETEYSEDEFPLDAPHVPGAAARAEFEEINRTVSQPEHNLRFPTTQSTPREYSFSREEQAVSPQQKPKKMQTEVSHVQSFSPSTQPEYSFADYHKALSAATTREQIGKIGEDFSEDRNITSAQRSSLDQYAGARYFSLPETQNVPLTQEVEPLVETERTNDWRLDDFRIAIVDAKTRKEIADLEHAATKNTHLSVKDRDFIKASAKSFSDALPEGSGFHTQGKKKNIKKGGQKFVQDNLEPYLTKTLKPNKFNGIPIGGKKLNKRLTKKQQREKEELLTVPLENFQVEMVQNALSHKNRNPKKTVKTNKPLELSSADQEGLWFL